MADVDRRGGATIGLDNPLLSQVNRCAIKVSDISDHFAHYVHDIEAARASTPHGNEHEDTAEASKVETDPGGLQETQSGWKGKERSNSEDQAGLGSTYLEMVTGATASPGAAQPLPALTLHHHDEESLALIFHPCTNIAEHTLEAEELPLQDGDQVVTAIIPNEVYEGIVEIFPPGPFLSDGTDMAAFEVEHRGALMVRRKGRIAVPGLIRSASHEQMFSTTVSTSPPASYRTKRGHSPHHQQGMRGNKGKQRYIEAVSSVPEPVAPAYVPTHPDGRMQQYDGNTWTPPPGMMALELAPQYPPPHVAPQQLQPVYISSRLPPSFPYFFPYNIPSGQGSYHENGAYASGFAPSAPIFNVETVQEALPWNYGTDIMLNPMAKEFYPAPQQPAHMQQMASQPQMHYQGQPQLQNQYGYMPDYPQSYMTNYTPAPPAVDYYPPPQYYHPQPDPHFYPPAPQPSQVVPYAPQSVAYGTNHPQGNDGHYSPIPFHHQLPNHAIHQARHPSNHQTRHLFNPNSDKYRQPNLHARRNNRHYKGLHPQHRVINQATTAHAAESAMSLPASPTVHQDPAVQDGERARSEPRAMSVTMEYLVEEKAGIEE